MIFGYARVSTKTQARDGNSLDAQQAALTAAGAEKIYTDTFTGTKIERPEFDRLRAQLRKGDVLIVTKLDRLARSVSQASGLITEMIDEGITINVLNLGILSNDSVNTLLRNVLLSFAQFERDMIVQRTQEGKAVARATTRISVRAARPSSTPSSSTMQWLCLRTTPTRRSSSSPASASPRSSGRESGGKFNPYAKWFKNTRAKELPH
ncbi:recombinase family protein [Butyricicoccus sp. OF10-2]|uniref:recombinase family protein n=1 Tax=Butyricicoccus sp. OF10-2 TaxID=2292298 RepID=UPI001FA9BF63|nr:recombinase family protein [Butyricicoccus sp. OF10-2]